ncbi:MAG TPA: type II toxin-antitoxin system MqsA family antitoxin [Gammaproteobacteria bacterium]|nr:type II toxin-antitoxin system MqsA family antitoxin [Gammaproteobacteria bacterium]HQZ87475.1 type II toxin-antitoxin system MqsA family antitoxin [Gammaproteobacteria bacterium]HRA42577.1 type II toxin-antitoxin system MqsA family antitoxin [Gammaproteobacteria bacterium]
MKCPACGKGNLLKKVKSQMFTYKGSSIMLEQPGLWCNQCDDGILSGQDIEVTEKSFEEFKAKVDGLLSPDDIRRIRRYILGLTQQQAAEIFGGGKNAFSRYESGEIKPSLPLSNLLKMFERHPEDIKYFTKDNL